MDQPEGENRNKHSYDSNDKPQGSTAKLPSLDFPELPEENDLVFASNGLNTIERSPVPTGPTSQEKPVSGNRPQKTPSALAPTVDAFQLTPPPKKLPPRKYNSQTRKLSLGPSNLMLAILWTIAVISVGWAAYFYLTQP